EFFGSDGSAATGDWTPDRRASPVAREAFAAGMPGGKTGFAGCRSGTQRMPAPGAGACLQSKFGKGVSDQAGVGRIFLIRTLVRPSGRTQDAVIFRSGIGA